MSVLQTIVIDALCCNRGSGNIVAAVVATILKVPSPVSGYSPDSPSGPTDLLETAAPAFTVDEAVALAHAHFGIEASADALPSERDQNFKLTSGDGRRFVLKIANANEDRSALEFENAALEHIRRNAPGFPVPRIVAGDDGPIVEVTGATGATSLVRVMSWIDGRSLRDVAVGAALEFELGATLATLGTALRGFFHPAAGKKLLWDIRRIGELSSWVDFIEDAELRRLSGEFIGYFTHAVAPRLGLLRSQVIHNDLNSSNVLLSAATPPRVAGVVDFGDAMHAPLVFDVAVAAAYRLSDDARPLEPAMHFVAGYHSLTPLSDDEYELLFDLIRARLVASIAIAAWRVRRHPGNRDYILLDSAAAGRHLRTLSQLNATDVYQQFRSAPTRFGIDRKDATSNEALLTRREQSLGSAYRLFYDQPVHVTRGAGVWLYDDAGNAFLDAYNNVPLVGHCQPDVVAALHSQAATLNTHTRYLHERVIEYAERLLELFPKALDRVLFSCSGSEANELALRIARAVTGNAGVIITKHAYHGNTTSVAELSPSDSGRTEFPNWIEAIPPPDTYRRDGQPGTDEWSRAYLAEVDEAIERMRARGVRPAALLLDSAFTSDGLFLPPPGLLATLAERIREAGGVYVADEVQSGFGRLGQALWGFELHAARPDIVTLGKSIGNGHPLAATVVRHELLDEFAAQSHYFNTFGGNPVSAAVGLAVLDVLAREGLLENSRNTGAYLDAGLRRLQAASTAIGDVRGSGLFAAVELVANGPERRPDKALASRIVNDLRVRRILISTEGPHGNILKIRPPLPFGREHVDRLLEALSAVLPQ